VGGYLRLVELASGGEGGSQQNVVLPLSLHTSVLAALLHRGKLAAALQVVALMGREGRRLGGWRLSEREARKLAANSEELCTLMKSAGMVTEAEFPFLMEKIARVLDGLKKVDLVSVNH